jgi:class 3 adenylate cyclase/DNA polymerase III delta prime subunit
MQPIVQWLEGLGLGQYGASFVEADIDLSVLPDLTETDLSQLGVTVGHRKKLLRAIAALTSTAGAVGPEVPTAPAIAAEAERRQLSILFCDLVGSTQLALRLDPEDLRTLIGNYHRQCALVIERENGFVARYMGDGLLAYFGYPQAHEEDAERAVRAGLALVESAGKLIADLEPLQVRVGIATGLVVVGDLIGTGAAQEQGVVGETPNLAARLQALAEPGGVVIADSTRRLTGGLFTYRELSQTCLKGFAEPVRAWCVLGPGNAESRFEALRCGACPLVGRDEEMEQLLRHWQQAKTRGGRVVLLSGEPGVGKSRLAQALAERITGEAHVRLRYFCSPHYQDSSLYPIISQMERAAGFAHDDTPATKLAKLRALLSAAEPMAEDVALISELHSLPLDDVVSLRDLTPQRKKEKTFAALIRQLELLSRQQPVLMVFEDLHWIDPSSHELLDRIIERIANWPVLLLATFRPEFQPPWISPPPVAALELARLGRRDTAALVQGIAGNHTLSPEVVERIVDRTDGVPLFVEELTKTVLESGAGAAAAMSDPTLAALSVPATLHASLMARLDRLGTAVKELAQVGAAFGREFAYQPLAAVPPKNEKLDNCLDTLIEAGLIFSRGTRPVAAYTFKHALIQDAAYDSLLRSSRKRLHARIVEVLEHEFPEVTESQPEVVAHHCVEAERFAQAVEYYLRAGRRAMERSANAEAVAHLQKGLDALTYLPEDSTRLRYELDLQTALGPALMPIKGWGAPEVEQAYVRARALCDQLGATPQLFGVLRGLWEYYELRAHTGPGLESARQVLALAEDAGDRTLLVIAHDVMGDTSLWIGDFAASNAHTTQGIALYDRAQDRGIAYAHGGYDPAMACRAFGAHALWYLGYPDRAFKQSEDAVTFARGLAHPPSIMHALSHAAWHHIFRHQAKLAHSVAQAALDLSTQHDSKFFMAHSSISLGWALANEGYVDEGISEIRKG